MAHEIECVVWCAHCGKDKFRVLRKPTPQNGVFEHGIEVIGQGLKDRKTCADCGTNLSRKEDHG